MADRPAEPVSRRARRLQEAALQPAEPDDAPPERSPRLDASAAQSPYASPYLTTSSPYDLADYSGSSDYSGYSEYAPYAEYAAAPAPVAVPERELAPEPEPTPQVPPQPAPEPDPEPEPQPEPPPLRAVPPLEEFPDRPPADPRRIGDPRELRGWRRVLDVAGLPTVGFLLLVWAMTTLVGDVRWGPLSVLPVAFACLSPLVVVPAVPLVLTAIQRRRWAALVPAVAAIVLPWAFVAGYVLPADAPSGPTVPLRAMLVTAEDGHADAADVADAVRSQRPDLLVVTELSSGLAHDLTAAGLPDGLTPRYVSVPEGGEPPTAGIAIYSRFAVSATRPVSGMTWPGVVARVMVGRTPVTLVAGHAVQPSAGHLDRWRRDLAAVRGAEQIKGPVLVLANLNATPWNAQYRWVVSGRLHDSADVLGRGLRPTWPNWSPVPLLPTDHALVAGLGVTELAALPIEGSDHRALSVGLLVPTR